MESVKGYTQHVENMLWKMDDYEDEAKKVIDFLNSDFRPFGKAVLTLMQKKVKAPIPNPSRHIKEACKRNNVPVEKIARSENTLRTWFSGGERPVKSVKSRNAMFALAFALNFDTKETRELFHKAYLDRACNERNYSELIYYYCLQRGLPYVHAEALINAVCIKYAENNDATMYTQQLSAQALAASNDQALLDYIHAHGHNFLLNNQSAKETVAKLKAEAHEFARHHGEYLQKYEPEIAANKNFSSDSFLYFSITNRGVTGRTGTKPLSFKNAELPKEIKSNFPQLKQFSLDDPSYEELRKMIILLFSYVFWSKMRRFEGTVGFDDYIDQLDKYLVDAGMAKLYYGNPFDWLFLYCTTQEYPLDVFQDILESVLENNGN